MSFDPNPSKILRIGSYREIADSLPGKLSVVFATGHLDASHLIDVICDLRGSPASLGVRVQVPKSRAELQAFIDGQSPDTKLFATTFVIDLLFADFDAETGNRTTPSRRIDELDPLVARIPADGCVIVFDAHTRCQEVGARIVEFGGIGLAEKVLFLIAATEEAERDDLAKVPGFPVLYDPAWPEGRRKLAADRAPGPVYGEEVAKPTASFSGVAVPNKIPAPVPVAPPVEGETFPERLDRLVRIARKIRIAKRRARRASGAAELATFVAGLPTGQNYGIVAGCREHLSFVRQLIEDSDRADALTPWISYFVQSDLILGADLLSMICTGMGQDAGDLPLIAAPGALKTQERARVRRAVAEIKAAHPARKLVASPRPVAPPVPTATVEVEPAPINPIVVTYDPPKLVADLPIRMAGTPPSYERAKRILDTFFAAAVESLIDGFGLLPFAPGGIDGVTIPLNGYNVQHIHLPALYDGPFLPIAPEPAPTRELTLGGVEPGDWGPAPEPTRLGWICPRCDVVLSPDVLRCDGC